MYLIVIVIVIVLSGHNSLIVDFKYSMVEDVVFLQWHEVSTKMVPIVATTVVASSSANLQAEGGEKEHGGRGHGERGMERGREGRREEGIYTCQVI